MTLQEHKNKVFHTRRRKVYVPRKGILGMLGMMKYKIVKETWVEYLKDNDKRIELQ